MAPSSEASTSRSSTTPQEHSQQIQKPYSCVLCAQRKVKCDKAPGGCSHCAKARVDCIYKAPPPPRRRRKGQKENDDLSRLRIYEDALRKLGVDTEELIKQETNRVDETRSPRDARAEKKNGSRGVLVSGEGKSRYLENTLWTSLTGEFRDSMEFLDDTDSGEDDDRPNDASCPSGLFTDGASLLLGPRTTTFLRPLHPQPVQVFKLWQTYLDNINPLLKVFHTPSVQQIISNTSGNLEHIPKNVEALLFSIYSVAVESLSEAECDAIMGESKTIVGQRFRAAAQHALVNASFIKTSDLMVLQALVLFIASLQNYDGRAIWILTGVARRIGQRIGLHRDPETLDVPPFESEIRRRLWWQIVIQDGVAERMAGTGGAMFVAHVKRPSNVNDSDLFPGMKGPPKEHEGATEMMFFLIRIHLGEFLSKNAKDKVSAFDGMWAKLITNPAPIAVKDQAIDDLEAMYENKFLQYCDKEVTWHSMCTYLVKAVIAMLRFMTHAQENPDTDRNSIPGPELDMQFNLAVSILGYTNLAYTTKEMQGYLWHINSHFQWKAFIYVLSELRYRAPGAPEVDNAWKQVQLVYDFHPNFSKPALKTALPIAVDNLALKAWDTGVARRAIPANVEPYFIQMLRRRNAKLDGALTRASSRQAVSSASQPVSSASQPVSSASSVHLDAGQTPFAVTHPATQFAGFGARTAFPQQQQQQQQQSQQPQHAQSFPLTHSDPVEAFQWDTTGFAASLEATAPVVPGLPFDPDQMNWANWDELLADFEMQGMGAEMSGAGALMAGGGQGGNVGGVGMGAGFGFGVQ